MKVLVVDPMVKSEITECIDKTWLKTKSEDMILDFTRLEKRRSRNLLPKDIESLTILKG